MVLVHGGHIILYYAIFKLNVMHNRKMSEQAGVQNRPRRRLEEGAGVAYAVVVLVLMSVPAPALAPASASASLPPSSCMPFHLLRSAPLASSERWYSPVSTIFVTALSTLRICCWCALTNASRAASNFLMFASTSAPCSFTHACASGWVMPICDMHAVSVMSQS